jgi:hypothetical protein
MNCSRNTVDNNRFLSNLSAKNPAIGGARNIGDIAANVTKPTEAADPDIVYTNQPLETINAQLAAPANSDESHKNLKSEYRNDINT